MPQCEKQGNGAAARVPDNVDLSQLLASNEDGEIVRMRADVEVASAAVPVVGVAMPEADGNGPVRARKAWKLLVLEGGVLGNDDYDAIVDMIEVTRGAMFRNGDDLGL